MYTWIRLLVLIYSFISSIVFLSNSKTLNFLSHFPVRLTKSSRNLIHIWAMGWSTAYTKYKQPEYTRSFIFFFFLSFQLAKIKNLHRSTKLFQHNSAGYGRGYVSFAHCLLYLWKHWHAHANKETQKHIQHEQVFACMYAHTWTCTRALKETMSTSLVLTVLSPSVFFDYYG